MVLNLEGLSIEGLHSGGGGGHCGQPPRQSQRKKIIIDTDPGIDDMMAILMAFQSPEIEVLGLTTVFGNVETSLATTNALYLCEVAGFPTVPVAEGSPLPLKGVQPRIADFVHGTDGLGNTHQAKPHTCKIKQSACDFLVEKVAEFPGKVTVVALGPLTNIAKAIQKDPNFAKNVAQLVVLGGSFFASGNVNPAAEANIYGDPEAADITFTSGADAVVIGINLTTQVTFTGLFLHDPTCMVALLNPSLFTFKTGALRVETEGICVGLTLMDTGLKNWVGNNPWMGQPPVKVGWTVDAEGVKTLVKEVLCRP